MREWCILHVFHVELSPLNDAPYSPDISRVECTHIQDIRAADVVVYLNALITQKMGALGSPRRVRKSDRIPWITFCILGIP